MNNRPLITVAIPAYKSDFLESAIESVVNQTYRNLEILVVDDQSPNNVKSIVEKFSDSRICYHRNAENLGKKDPANNWNECLRLAKGEFFSLLCDDDIYSTNFVEEMLVLAEKFPNVGVFRARVKLIDQNGKLLNFYPSSPEYETAINYMIDMGNGVRKQTISEFMYRTDFLKKQGGYANLPKAMCADHLTIYRLGLKGGIASSLLPLVSFRLSDINLSGHGLDSSNIKEKLIANNLFVKEIEKLVVNSDEETKNLIISKHKNKFREANIIVMSCANFKDWLYIVCNRMQYDLSSKMIFKALILKIKNFVKRIVL